MITLFRWIRLKQLQIKWKLALMQFVDKQAMTIIKNPKEIEKKIMPFLAEIIHMEANKTEESDVKK